MNGRPSRGGIGGGTIHNFTPRIRPSTLDNTMKIGAFFLPKQLRKVFRTLDQQAETIQRLEIAVRHQALAIHALSGDLEALSERVARVAGRLGAEARDRKGRTKAKPEGAQLDIEDIPPGDKAALRRALGIGIVKREQQ